MKRTLSIIMIIISIAIFIFINSLDDNMVLYVTLSIADTAIFIFGVKMFISSKSKTDKFIENNYEKEVARLKTYGEKVKVNFENCEITTRKNYKELTPGHNAIDKWDYMFDTNKKVPRTEIIRTRIVFNHNGEEYYSPSVSMEKDTLSFYLYDKKETNLYIDRQNSGLYYFDLEFLMDE